MNDIIEKAKWNVGDIRTDKNGAQWECSGFNSKGQAKWVKPKGNKGNKTDDQPTGGKKPAKNDDVPGVPKGQGNQPQQKQPSQQKPQVQGKGSQPNFKDMNPDELVDFANSAKTSALAAVVNNKNIDLAVRQIAFNALKKRNDYKADEVDSSDLPNGHTSKPKPKIDYKNKKSDVEIEVPDTWRIRVPGKNGVLENKTVSASAQRKLMAGKTDDELLKVLNNEKATWQNRQLAYDEAAARGIKEDKINVEGTLQKQWDSQKRHQDYVNSMSGGYNEEEAVSVDVDLKGLDAEKFMKEFPEGDDGWLNKDDPRVQKQFNGFKTIADRQQYDALKTLYEPTTPGYLNPDNKIGQLNEQYDNLIKYDTTPLFISAGGAGAGKTFGWQTVAEENNLKQLTEDDDPSDGDWGYVMCSDPDDDKDFRRMLAKYNGTYIDDNGEEHPHIMVFDDADKILTSKAGAMKALMKKITDNNPKNRVFINPDTGETEVFKGALLIMTNKDVAAISSANEDAKAIMSRGMVNDMQFTRAETMELINKRFDSMKLGSYQKAFEKQFPDKAKQKEIRQIARDWLEENMNDADPGKFTPRTFIQVMSLIGPIMAKGGKAKAKMINGSVQVGTNVPWQAQALKLIKAEDDELEKADEDNFSQEERVAAKEELLNNKETAKKGDKKRYNALYGQDAIDAYLYGEDGDSTDDEEVEDKKPKKKAKKSKKVKKSFEDEFGMSLSEAEDLLLG